MAASRRCPALLVAAPASGQGKTTVTAALARHGRNGVPLYLLHRPGQAEPLILPEILTPGLLLETLAGLR